MKIINLIEDTKGVEGCRHEHGLSFYIETKNHKLLLDTGATEAFLDNALVLGIDLKMVFVILVILALTFIFKYGAILQQESDETL